MVKFTKKDLRALVKGTGYPMASIEKTMRLLDLLKQFNEDEFLEENLVLKGGTAINVIYHSELYRLSVDLDFDLARNTSKEDMLVIKDKVSERMAEKCYGLSPYAYCAGDPVNLVDPDGKEIKGQKKDDAKKVVEDIRAIFAASEFDSFRNLIVQSGKNQNRKSLAVVNEDALKAAFDGVNLSEDQKALVDIVVNTINSDDVHTIEFADVNGIVSADAMSAYKPVSHLDRTIEIYGGLPTSVVANSGGGGITLKTSKGTHSVIVSPGGQHPVGRAVTTGHELFGHGRSLAQGRTSELNQHIDAIQTENLIRRVMGIVGVNDGSNHSEQAVRAKAIFNPISIPAYR